jgi:hypothetical protein
MAAKKRLALKKETVKKLSFGNSPGGRFEVQAVQPSEACDTTTSGGEWCLTYACVAVINEVREPDADPGQGPPDQGGRRRKPRR